MRAMLLMHACKSAAVAGAMVLALGRWLDVRGIDGTSPLTDDAHRLYADARSNISSDHILMSMVEYHTSLLHGESPRCRVMHRRRRMGGVRRMCVHRSTTRMRQNLRGRHRVTEHAESRRRRQMA
jgi:hypothetical protein